MVSDRAKALVKLGKEIHFGTGSAADLFHFIQELNRGVGCRLGTKLNRRQRALDKADVEDKGEISEEIQQLEQTMGTYREEIRLIHKSLHPFNEGHHRQDAEEINPVIYKTLREIEKIAGGEDIKYEYVKIAKTVNQVEDLTLPIRVWNDWVDEAVENFEQEESLKSWLKKYLLPYHYWQKQLEKLGTKARDEALQNHYKLLIEQAQSRLEQHPPTPPLSAQRLVAYHQWAQWMVNKFQRSSSQLEGRNGYLAFIHHANRGITKQRMEALTTVHNFDIRRNDGRTPANRLFNREFPDLFEFILQNVKDLPSPRKSAKIISLRRDKGKCPGLKG